MVAQYPPMPQPQQQQEEEEDEAWPTFAPADDDEAGAGIDVSNYDETLGFLRCFDTMFIVDDSAHMAPYWDDVGQLLGTLSGVCAKHDPDGIDIYFLNHRPKSLLPHLLSVRRSGYRGIGGPEAKKDRKTAEAIFGKVKPGGRCLLGARLGKILNWYCDKLKADDENAALNLIVITAGVFEDDVRAPLVSCARMLDDLKMPEHQVGIQLFNIRPDAAVQQQFDYLDDELHKENRTRDIVDTTTWSGKAGSLSSDDLLKVILGAVVKKLDERKSALSLDRFKSVRVKRSDD